MTTNLKSRAYQHIREEMMRGNLAEGDFFSPRKIAKTIGMSYTPVREAILQLQNEGLVEKVGNRGVRLRSLTIEELIPAFELRIVMETGAAELAAEKISDKELAYLRKNIRKQIDLLKKLRAKGRLGQLTEEFFNHVDDQVLLFNFEFHLTVVNATHNPQLVKNIGDARLLTRCFNLRVHFMGKEYMDQDLRDFLFHYRIYRALARRDVDSAREWIRKHLKNAFEYNMAIQRMIQSSRTNNQNRPSYSEALLVSMQTFESRLGDTNRTSK